MAASRERRAPASDDRGAVERSAGRETTCSEFQSTTTPKTACRSPRPAFVDQPSRVDPSLGIRSTATQNVRNACSRLFAVLTARSVAGRHQSVHRVLHRACKLVSTAPTRSRHRRFQDSVPRASDLPVVTRLPLCCNGTNLCGGAFVLVNIRFWLPQVHRSPRILRLRRPTAALKNVALGIFRFRRANAHWAMSPRAPGQPLMKQQGDDEGGNPNSWLSVRGTLNRPPRGALCRRSPPLPPGSPEWPRTDFVDDDVRAHRSAEGFACLMRSQCRSPGGRRDACRRPRCLGHDQHAEGVRGERRAAVRARGRRCWSTRSSSTAWTQTLPARWFRTATTTARSRTANGSTRW